jgi:hypothetical protein
MAFKKVAYCARKLAIWYFSYCENIRQLTATLEQRRENVRHLSRESLLERLAHGGKMDADQHVRSLVHNQVPCALDNFGRITPGVRS